jgi:decaprenyl-phosphate phosphoribosyltransferase
MVDTPTLLKAPESRRTRPWGLIGAIASTARPRQWAKNVLVFGAPATGGVLFEPGVLLATLVAFLAFCLAASGVYFMNDVVDVSVDRMHPTKSLRPVTAGA